MVLEILVVRIRGLVRGRALGSNAKGKFRLRKNRPATCSRVVPLRFLDALVTTSFLLLLVRHLLLVAMHLFLVASFSGSCISFSQFDPLPNHEAS